MLTILSKKVFRFKRPGIDILREGEQPKQQNFGEIYFDTIPGEPQQAPDWIKDDTMWELAAADGDLMEIVPTAGRSSVAASQQSAANQEAGARARLDGSPDRGLDEHELPRPTGVQDRSRDDVRRTESEVDTRARGTFPGRPDANPGTTANPIGEGLNEATARVRSAEQQPGTQQPGTQQPGTQQPGTQQPGTQQPGTQGTAPTTGLVDQAAVNRTQVNFEEAARTRGTRPADREQSTGMRGTVATGPLDQAAVNRAQVNLETMSKAQLIEHAADEHDLELNPGLNKEQLIAKVKEAQARK